MPFQTVVELAEFQRKAARLMTDNERHELIDFISQNPEAGVSLGGGIRKVRFACNGAGKSGGFRSIHYFGGGGMPVFLLTVFAKNEKGNLSLRELTALRAVGAAILSDFGGGDE